jgi:4-amino-4-deoxy-L-arabinose transferase-like glycosyltransferase
VAAIAIFLVLGSAYVQRAIPRGASNFDSANYEAMTKQWLETGVYGYWALDNPGEPDAVVTPGYPIFLAPFYYFSEETDPQTPGGPYSLIFTTQLFIGAVLLFLVWLYARMVATQRAANIAVLLLAPMWSFYNTVGVVLTSLLATTLIMGYFVVLGLAFQRRNQWLALAAGFLLAAGLLTRPTLALASLIPLVLGFSSVIKPQRRQALFALVGIALPFIPWIVRNWATFGRPMLIEGRTDPIVGGVDPYFRGQPGTETQTHGVSLGNYATMKEYDQNLSPLAFGWRIVKLNFASAPHEVVGWFTVGKLQYLAFANLPASATEGAIDGILLSSVSSLGLTGAFLSIRWRDLVPTAAMVAVWLAQNTLMVPDQRYWFDILPFLAVLAGALISAAWGRAPISKARAAARTAPAQGPA